MKYRHYSPCARVAIVSPSARMESVVRAAFIGTKPLGQRENFLLYRVCRDSEEYAHALFAFFRQCDAANISVIYCQSVKTRGIGLALMDRLQRATH